ncbi:unnamed protein product [Prorocentrum cordatum]|uniref:Uncharacterized protein n=2 Tax=Prorocentrum cordatum TaxID=2364126 RepID=A0ABN9YDI2_9DINO|nr:unnamed protein product [Polarella glacialis]
MERLALAGFLLARLPGRAGGAGEAAFAWPESDVGPRTPPLLQAGKRAAKHLECEICQLRLAGLLFSRAEEKGRSWPNSRAFRDALGETKSLCEEGALMHHLTALNLTLRLDPYSDRAYLEEGDPPWSLQALSGDNFNWKAFAAHHACLEAFRRGGDKIAAGVKEAYRGLSGAEDGSTEEQSRRLSELAQRGCSRTRGCKALVVERELDVGLEARDRELAARDPSYEPAPSDFAAPRSVEYEANVDYYHVLGVNDTALCSEERGGLLLSLYGTERGRALSGVADVFADAHERDLKAAQLLLCDRATRRQYDRDRGRVMLRVRHGLQKAKPDRPHLDGAAMVLAYEDELAELGAARSEL